MDHIPFATVGTALALLAGTVAPAALAAVKLDDSPTRTIAVSGTCDLTGFVSIVQTLSPAVTIPDDDPAGVTFGPVVTAADSSTFTDVVVELSLSHTWIGDLVVTLSYDQDCDGQPEDSTRVLCRPGRSSCFGGSGFGSSKDFSCSNTLLFSDSAASDVGGGQSPVPAACYKPTGNGADPLNMFIGLASGGCWSLNVADRSVEDLGSVCGWGVHTRNQQIVPVRVVSWGSLKTRYR